MVSVFSILTCCVTLFICLFLPVLVLIGFAVKCRRQGIVSAWLLGAAGFFVTQILIRLPDYVNNSGKSGHPVLLLI